MPSKRKKYNAKFPAGRIKKIMQSDEEVGKVAQAVPVIISRTVELFIESLLEKTFRITKARNAKTLSPSHMKQCIMSENRFDFLRELVKEIPDISVAEEAEQDLATPTSEHSQQSYNFNMPSTSCSVIVKPTVNGSSLKNGTIQQTNRSVSTPDSVPLTFPPKIQNSTDLKRTRDIAPRPAEHSSSTIIRANFYKENTDVQNMPDAMDPPPKLCRTDSAPPNVSFQNDNTIATVIKKPQRRLQHQSKSIPCTSKETLQPPAVPPPIINIDVCNTPIVKIDYSNLTIPDTDSVEPSFKKKKDPSTNTSNSPIINIDLSKIAAQFSTNPLPAPPQLQTNNALDLDEDYDNI